MNKYVRFLLPAFAVLFLFNTAATETPGQILREVLKRMDNNNKSLTSLKAAIKMNKFDSVLRENDLKEGEVNYLPGKSEKNIYVRIDWTKPVVEHLAVANGQYVLYRPALEQAITGKVDRATGSAKTGGALAFMTMSKAELSANYEVKYQGEESVSSGTSTWRLLLTPKKPTSYKGAELWVDKDGMPVQAKIVEKNNDTTTILLSNIKRNATLKASLFKISPPKRVKIIQG